VTVQLGPLSPDTIAPTVLALVERGAARQPELAGELAGSLALRFDEGYPAIRIEFAAGEITVGDDERPADVEIAGRLPDVVALITAPLAAGVPNPFSADGRAALARLARGHVEVTGSRTLGRRMLRLLSLA
jgi:hypothetical protein